MKSDLTSCRYYYPKAANSSGLRVNNFMNAAPSGPPHLGPNISRSFGGGGNESLIGLRNHLSDLINWKKFNLLVNLFFIHYYSVIWAATSLSLNPAGLSLSTAGYSISSSTCSGAGWGISFFMALLCSNRTCSSMLPANLTYELSLVF